MDQYFITSVHNTIRPPCLAYNGNDSECEPTQAATRTTAADAHIEIEPVAPHALGHPIAAPWNNDQQLVAHTCTRRAGDDSVGDLRLEGKRPKSTLVAATVQGGLDVPNTRNAHPIV